MKMNTKQKKFLRLAKSKKVRVAYEKMLKKYGAKDSQELTKKLREG